VTAPRLAALLEIGRALAPRAKRLAADVTRAFDDPAGYLSDHSKAMRERGIAAPRRNLPWIALIDALADAGVLFALGWKHDASEVAHARRKLVRASMRSPVLAVLDMRADDYPLVAVPAAQLAKLARLAKRAGYGTIDAFEPVRREPEREPQPAGTSVARDGETRSIELFKRKRGMDAHFEIHRDGPDGAVHEIHYFSGDATADKAMRAQLAAWHAAGFVRAARRAKTTAPHFEALPLDGTYFIDKRKVVWIGRRDAAVHVLHGDGKSFGARQIVFHLRSARAAARDAGERTKAYAKVAARTTRDAIVNRYRKLGAK
jgi:hypothetical protein